MLARDFLEQTAQRTPAKTALVCQGRRFSYATLESQSNRLAQALIAAGIGRGERVAFQLPNGPEAVVSIFGILKAGATFVPIAPGVKFPKLDYILDNCRPTALVQPAFKSLPPTVPGLRLVIHCQRPGDGAAEAAHLNPSVSTLQGSGSSPLPCLDWDQIQRQNPDLAPAPLNSESDLACLLYTSGSTGQPKGVMCEHRSVAFVSASIIEYLHNTDSDIVLNALPLSFDYGLYQVLMTFRFGGTLVLEESGAFPALLLQRIAEERVTGLPGVPTLFSLLLQQPLRACELSSLRYLTNTAAALPAGQIQALRRQFPQAQLFSMYGLTETKRTLYLPPKELERRPNSVGIPIPGTRAWVENPHGERLGPNQVGELVVCGPHVMGGYWRDPQATAHRFRLTENPAQRLCYSGDLFREDEEGFFYFVGRMDDMIKSRGEKIAPREVEAVLYSLPGVREAAVVGVPDPLLGQTVKAFLVYEGGACSPARVQAHCRRYLEEVMVPREIEFRPVLPHTLNGKIDKLALTTCATPPV